MSNIEITNPSFKIDSNQKNGNGEETDRTTNIAEKTKNYSKSQLKKPIHFSTLKAIDSSLGSGRMTHVI